MNGHSGLTFATITALMSLALALPAGHAVAQEKQRVSFKMPAENTKYTQSISLAVSDVPNHILRAYDVHTTYPSNAPVINGVKLVESSITGIGDRLDGSGDGRRYFVFVMENGDKFFVRDSQIVQNRSGKTNDTGSGVITGGTGKFAGMRGLVLQSGSFDIKTGVVEAQYDIEYWMEK
jgi:hypothetical protein